MRPGQVQPNELEIAIFQSIAATEPSIKKALGQLHVLSREFTGVGSFTKFKCPDSDTRGRVNLNGHIRMQGVPNGLGAVLWLKDGIPASLEIFAFGEEHWDGTFESFSIEDAV